MSSKLAESINLEVQEGYDQLESGLRHTIKELKGKSLFTTSINEGKLWEFYIGNIPYDRRQYYNCNCCRRFIQKYGGLVTIDEDGHKKSALWTFGIPPFFQESVRAIVGIIDEAHISGVFYSSDTEWGLAQTGSWTHLSSYNPNVFKHTLKSDSQMMAEKLEEYGMLCRGLAEYPIDVAKQAVRVINSDALYRANRVLGVGEWFLDLQTKLEGANRYKKVNYIWQAVASAPIGFAHVRSSMIGTLLDDIKAGMDFDAISKRFKDKMDPMQYQRVTKVASIGNIKQAEQIVEKLGIARSLERRFARLDEIQDYLIWKTTEFVEEKTKGKGVFGELKPNHAIKAIELPPINISWEKFHKNILPSVLSMEANCPNRGNYYALVTSAVEDSEPIFQWDGLKGFPRNPFSSYVYHNFSSCENWGIKEGFNNIAAIFPHSARFQDPSKFSHISNCINFCISACKDAQNHTLALFPENLRSDLHSVRATIENFSKKGKISGKEYGNANGLRFEGNSILLRVRTKEGFASYLIDRMD